MTEEKDFEIVPAKEADRAQILALYKMQIGREFCPWDEHYPGDHEIDYDLSRDALFVMKKGETIVAAISLEKDENVDRLSCWSGQLEPGGEIARLAVLPREQGKGFARTMVRFAMDRYKELGCKSIRLLVNRHNKAALRTYEPFCFDVVGECFMYEQEFFCYEKAL